MSRNFPRPGSQSPDPRAQRTRTMLQDALRSLVAEKGVAEVTVRGITRRAGLNRGTFYLHYQHKEDLLNQTIENALDAFGEKRRVFFSTREDSSLTEVPPFLVGLFEHFGHGRDFYRSLLNQEGSPMFVSRLVGHLEATIIDELPFRLPQRLSAIPRELVAHHLAVTVLGVLSWWLDLGEKHAAEEAAAWCWQLVAAYFA